MGQTSQESLLGDGKVGTKRPWRLRPFDFCGGDRSIQGLYIVRRSSFPLLSILLPILRNCILHIHWLSAAFKMYLKPLSVLFLASAASAQMTPSLTAALASNDQLSSLAQFVKSVPNLATRLSNTTNITILAPSNDALKMVTNSSNSMLMQPGVLQAVLQYHILKGTYMSDAILETPTFVHTLLMNNTYPNLTGGQVVEAVNRVTMLSSTLDC